MQVLGIDPGIASTGWGFVSFSSGKLSARSCGTITTTTKHPLEERIIMITDELTMLMKECRADALSIEDIFFLKNISSAIPVAKVIGAVIHLASLQNIPFFCYTPLQIKLALTGMGKASKSQVEQMVAFLLGLRQGEAENHASDALAAAICHIHTAQGSGSMHR